MTCHQLETDNESKSHPNRKHKASISSCRIYNQMKIVDDIIANKNIKLYHATSKATISNTKTYALCPYCNQNIKKHWSLCPIPMPLLHWYKASRSHNSNKKKDYDHQKETNESKVYMFFKFSCT